MDIWSLIVWGLLAGLLIHTFLVTWLRRRAFELRMQVLEVAELAVRRDRSIAGVIRRLAAELRGHRRALVLRVADALDRGEDLSEAVDRLGPRCFPPRIVAEIRAVEGTSALADVLASLVERTDDTLAVYHRVAIALLYPLGLACGVLATQDWVFRAYLSVSAAGGAGVPGAGLTGLLGSTLAVLLLFLVCVVRYPWGSVPWVRRTVLALVAAIPWSPRAGSQLRASRFLMTLSHLVGAGRSLPEAMRRATGAAGSPRLERGVRLAATALEAGESANDVWRRTGLPEFAVASVTAATNGSARDLAGILRRTAIACRERWRGQQERLLDLLHPVGVLLIGILFAVQYARMMSFTGHVREVTGLW